MPEKVCKDCYPEREQREAARQMGGAVVAGKLVRARPAPHPGPRCATHHREEKRRRNAARHGSYVQRTYGLRDTDYGDLYEAQGGVCAICRRANGATRKLSVDHDHSCCNGPTSCGGCVRGLLCRPCNDMLGHARDNWEMFARAIRYLQAPPAPAVLLDKRTS